MTNSNNPTQTDVGGWVKNPFKIILFRKTSSLVLHREYKILLIDISSVPVNVFFDIKTFVIY